MTDPPAQVACALVDLPSEVSASGEPKAKKGGCGEKLASQILEDFLAMDESRRVSKRKITKKSTPAEAVLAPPESPTPKNQLEDSPSKKLPAMKSAAVGGSARAKAKAKVDRIDTLPARKSVHANAPSKCKTKVGDDAKLSATKSSVACKLEHEKSRHNYRVRLTRGASRTMSKGFSYDPNAKGSQKAAHNAAKECMAEWGRT